MIQFLTGEGGLKGHNVANQLKQVIQFQSLCASVTLPFLHYNQWTLVALSKQYTPSMYSFEKLFGFCREKKNTYTHMNIATDTGASCLESDHLFWLPKKSKAKKVFEFQGLDGNLIKTNFHCLHIRHITMKLHEATDFFLFQLSTINYPFWSTLTQSLLYASRGWSIGSCFQNSLKQNKHSHMFITEVSNHRCSNILLFQICQMVKRLFFLLQSNQSKNNYYFFFSFHINVLLFITIKWSQNQLIRTELSCRNRFVCLNATFGLSVANPCVFDLIRFDPNGINVCWKRNWANTIKPNQITHFIKM